MAKIEPVIDKSEPLLDLLTEAAREGFGTEIGREDVRSHTFGADKLFISYEPDGRLSGFSSVMDFEISGNKVLYYMGTVVRKKYQGNGLYRQFKEEALSGAFYDFIALRTQNPVIYGAISKLPCLNRIYPNPACETPLSIQDIASKLAFDKLKMDNFDSASLIGRKTYGASLTPEIPFYSKEVNGFFEDKLNLSFSEGDSIILIGELNG